ncbi:heavy-metal-associated domain-containing protein [Lunatibacter salilacus]|uniref:heavy-metal-associated domain-containing protein n=1 Tax=Lunatibacter salilacus TaxID=2483804 RepID=UPI00131B9E17|nr:heavy metal transport/detoxification protein [Lunatibacter salilacus]
MIKLKKNVKCGACVATITPEMDALKATKWSVDLSHPDRILQVEGETTEENVKAALQRAGYSGESIR